MPEGIVTHLSRWAMRITKMSDFHKLVAAACNSHNEMQSEDQIDCEGRFLELFDPSVRTYAEVFQSSIRFFEDLGWQGG